MRQTIFAYLSLEKCPQEELLVSAGQTANSYLELYKKLLKL